MSSTVSCSSAAHSVSVSRRMPAQILATPTGWVMKSSPDLRRWSAWCSQAKTKASPTSSRSIWTAESDTCSSTIANRSSSRRVSVGVRPRSSRRARRFGAWSMVPTGLRVVTAPAAPLPRAAGAPLAVRVRLAAGALLFDFAAVLRGLAGALGPPALPEVPEGERVRPLPEAALPPRFTPLVLSARSGIGVRPRVAARRPGRPATARARCARRPGPSRPADHGRG